MPNAVRPGFTNNNHSNTNNYSYILDNHKIIIIRYIPDTGLALQAGNKQHNLCVYQCFIRFLLIYADKMMLPRWPNACSQSSAPPTLKASGASGKRPYQ